MDSDELLAIELTTDERFVLRCGLVEWGGPSHCTGEMAVAMGFGGVDDLFNRGDLLVSAIMAGDPLNAVDWCRALLATEISFISDLVGSGQDWIYTTGLSDETTLTRLCQIQRKMPRAVYAAIGNGIGTRPERPEAG